MQDALPQLQYRIQPLSRVKARGPVPGQDKRRPTDCEVKVGGRWHTTTGRFWTSFFARFGFSDSVFRYFTYQEVFDRICTVHPDVAIRVCTDSGSGVALAISNPEKPVVTPERFAALAAKYGGTGLSFHEGVASSIHVPQSGAAKMRIGPDDMYNRFTLETPLDGYGKPSIYLSLLRMVCENLAVAHTAAFRSDIAIGDNPEYNISRAIDSFDSDEGFSALRQRFTAAQAAPASLWECLKLHRIVDKISSGAQTPEIASAFDKAFGDIYRSYGVANLDAISEKKLHLLPSKSKVYDLINFASETATHRGRAQASTDSVAAGSVASKLYGWIGNIVSDEYDLEGTASASKRKDDFQALFLPASKAN
jgi:hypothetical protein